MANKSDFFANILKEAAALLEGEKDLIANTANISSLVYHELNSFHKSPIVNWVLQKKNAIKKLGWLLFSKEQRTGPWTLSRYIITLQFWNLFSQQ